MGGCSCWTRGRSLRVPFPNHHSNKNIPPFGRIFLLERVMGLTGGTGAVPPPARGTRKPFTGRFSPLTGTFPSSPTPAAATAQMGLEIGHRPACAPRRTVRPDTISRPLKSRHRRDFPLRVAASSPSFTVTNKNTPHSLRDVYYCKNLPRPFHARPRRS